MKIIRENTTRTYNYLASIYPYVPDETPDEDIGWQAVLTVSQHFDLKEPVVTGLSQHALNRAGVLSLRTALDAVLSEMDTIEQLYQTEQEQKQVK